jgi:hypothetical protein
VTARSLIGTFAGFKQARLSVHQASDRHEHFVARELRQDRKSSQPTLNYRQAGGRVIHSLAEDDRRLGEH